MITLLFLFLFLLPLSLQQDPNFHIFLAFGQSNMEGTGQVEDQDRLVNPRFQTMAACPMPITQRTENTWYPATPPLCRDNDGLSPCDYFGRQLVNKLPNNIRVGIINVAIGGSSIDLFDEDRVADYLQHRAGEIIKIIAKQYYNNNPYRHLVNKAKEAMKYGVIKGILLHQGESDNCDPNWPNKVAKIYYRMMLDLGLKIEEVPFIVGEVLRKEMGGAAGEHNKLINMLPGLIKNCKIVSSEGLPGKDIFHFTSEGYRIFGRRYADKYLEILGAGKFLGEK